jgi:hypothetical protein
MYIYRRVDYFLSWNNIMLYFLMMCRRKSKPNLPQRQGHGERLVFVSSFGF